MACVVRLSFFFQCQELRADHDSCSRSPRLMTRLTASILILILTSTDLLISTLPLDPRPVDDITSPLTTPHTSPNSSSRRSPPGARFSRSSSGCRWRRKKSIGSLRAAIGRTRSVWRRRRARTRTSSSYRNARYIAVLERKLSEIVGADWPSTFELSSTSTAQEDLSAANASSFFAPGFVASPPSMDMELERRGRR
ncbi:hypothetical protein SCHPADRAFT_98235 [Schizopora paradoxa]|uniref:Uncharacterized protein n=1 Tax=Schizopora paradoxa TaxID=27342 RepID=A0A0H2SNU8_9AGAM|nr:hypothetical protein SCHPADRAFT_98235 [Schizopora paradoxa]